jgi:putative FmdB family regulatory protein
MPFYEYECSNCRYYLEVMQKLSDAPLKKCPSCGKNALKKLISAPVFRLKGSGWYETDFKSDQEHKRNLAGNEAEPAAAAAPADKGAAVKDTKTETAAAPKAEATAARSEPAAETKRASSRGGPTAKAAGGSKSAAASKSAKRAAPARAAPTRAASKSRAAGSKAGKSAKGSRGRGGR